MIPCPHCSALLTEDQIFRIINKLMDRRKAACTHTNREAASELPAWAELCADCGATVEKVA